MDDAKQKQQKEENIKIKNHKSNISNYNLADILFVFIPLSNFLKPSTV